MKYHWLWLGQTFVYAVTTALLFQGHAPWRYCVAGFVFAALQDSTSNWRRR